MKETADPRMIKDENYARPILNLTRWYTEDIDRINRAALGTLPGAEWRMSANARRSLNLNMTVRYYAGKASSDLFERFMVKADRNGDQIGPDKKLGLVRPSLDWSRMGVTLVDALACSSQRRAPTDMVVQLLLRLREMSQSHKRIGYAGDRSYRGLARGVYSPNDIKVAKAVIAHYGLTLRYGVSDPTDEEKNWRNLLFVRAKSLQHQRVMAVSKRDSLTSKETYVARLVSSLGHERSRLKDVAQEVRKAESDERKVQGTYDSFLRKGEKNGFQA